MTEETWEESFLLTFFAKRSSREEVRAEVTEGDNDSEEEESVPTKVKS